MSTRYFKVAAVICTVMAIWTLGTFVVALFDPPPWNRVERFLEAWVWFYVALLHYALALVIPPGVSSGGAAE